MVSTTNRHNEPNIAVLIDYENVGLDAIEFLFDQLSDVGRAIVKLQDRWRRPLLVQIPLVPVRKGLVTDELLEGFVKGLMTARGLRRAVDRKFGRMPHDLTEQALDRGALNFVDDVLKYQDDSVRVRYRRLRLSVDKGTRLKNRLVDHGIMERI